METLSIACDFDGTITCHDTLHLIVERFGTPGVWESLEPALVRGELSVEEAMRRQFATVRAEPDEVLAFVRERAGLRAGFPQFVRWAAEGGHRLVVLSSGFRWLIERLLADWGLETLEVSAHDARFSRAGCTLLWSDRGAPCDLCGRPCKRHDVRRLALGRPLVYIGDGVSDRCVAPTADLIFARAGLARDLNEENVPFQPFENFIQVQERLTHPVRRVA